MHMFANFASVIFTAKFDKVNNGVEQCDSCQQSSENPKLSLFASLMRSIEC